MLPKACHDQKPNLEIEVEISDKSLLIRLGAGESIENVRSDAGLSREQFEEWWSEQLAARVPSTRGVRTASANAEILRDKWGIPHIYADRDDDLFFAYGYAMAQDRLWQLDYLRRKALGRLSEVLGPSSLEVDTVSRTVGMRQLAEAEVHRLPGQTHARLDAFSNGIDAFISESADLLPIEFDLLDYVPEPWSPVDSVAIWGEFRWYLTGRLPVIVIPEIARQSLADDSLYAAFLTGEAEDESILSPGMYPPRRSGTGRVGHTVSDSSEGEGSNNWAIAGQLTATGLPLLASDPHIAFGSVSCWYEVHLSGAGFNVTGTGYAGVPGVIFGRNEKVAWGLTNNICAQRDLYREKENPEKPGHYLYDDQWEPATETEETILVKGENPVVQTVRRTRNGPIVDAILPSVAADTGPVSLRWMGQEPCDEISSLLDMNRASNVDEFREALRAWVVPTFSFGFADVEGHIGYQASGILPIKEDWNRGYRLGWDPAHQWNETIPFEEMPSIADPPNGWVRSANNRTAPEDFPYPLSGVWSSGYRAQRIREMIESRTDHTRESVGEMQMDVLAQRASDTIPGLLQLLGTTQGRNLDEELDTLKNWDGRMSTDSVGASLFEVFFTNWTNEVASARFPANLVPLLAGAVSGLSTELLTEDSSGWFAPGDRAGAARRALEKTVDDLTSEAGQDKTRWNWGGIHKVDLRHALSSSGPIFERLSRGGDGVSGSGITVSNTGFDPNYMAVMGANYRLIADLADDPPGLWAVDAAGQSGNPGSANYCDQLASWMQNAHHFIPLERDHVEQIATEKLVIENSG
ncbi:MAG TPA: penicillin acylase family protein [Gemmatimonadetes bacterium]|nr:penicillin acylase family protein [Gemmatimonadota bacterium]